VLRGTLLTSAVVGEGEDIERTTDKGSMTVKLSKLEGFAKFLGVTRKTLNNWAKDHPEFLLALERIKEEQKERLIDSGLSGDYNSTIAKLVLSSDHDIRERSDHTTKGESIQPLIVSYADLG
jgi:hypothetical protein